MKYKIKQEKGLDVLYIYLDFNYEFSFEFLNKTISKIPFNGTIVKLIVGGIVLATLSLSSVNNNSFNYNISHNFFDNLNSVEILNDNSIDIKNKSDIEDKESEIKSINNNNKIDAKSNTVSKNSVEESEKVEQTNTSLSNTIEINSSNTPKSEELKGILVTVSRSNGLVEKLELENYLIGVVGAEMPASFNVEALKAQAVVARTYTLKKVSQGLSISDTVNDQVYKNNFELMTMWGNSYNTYYNKIKNAVESTKGKYIVYNGTYIEALYHSTSNGYTEDSKEVWGNNYEYLKSVESIWDKSASSYLGVINMSYNELENKLGISVSETTDIEVLSRNSSNRVKTIRVNNNYYTGVEFRNKLGLRSADFKIEKLVDGLRITTYGYGHGVGMSQYGANGMANSGYNYLDIIHHYYKGVNIASI